MKAPQVRSHEINTENTDFQAQIDAITNRALTPENIAAYAGEALTDLVSVVENAVTSYDTQPTLAANGIERERAALYYYGLDPSSIEETLDHIADVAGDIIRMGDLVARLTADGIHVITPPDSSDTRITPGNSSFEVKGIVPRIQTILLILEKSFGVDLEDEHQLKFIPGTITDNMMRRVPYHVLDIPKLNRVINACDEEGNRTFVFDRNILLERGITADVLKDMTKEQIKGLLKEEATIGHDLIYTHLFVENMVSLLHEIPERLQSDIVTDKDAAKFLKVSESAPDDYLTRAQIAEMLGIEIQAVHNASMKLRGQLNPVKARTRYNVADHYSPEDVETVAEYIRTKGALVPKHHPDEKSVFGMSKQFKVTRDAIYNALDAIGEQIGGVRTAKFGSVITEAYSLDQQNMIREWLNSNHKKHKMHEVDSEVGLDLTSYKNQLQLAQELDTITYWIIKIHQDSADMLGKVIKLGNQWQYSPSQQEYIRQTLEVIHSSKPESISDIPEGYMSRVQLGDEWGIHLATFDKAVIAVKEKLGTVVFIDKSNNTTAGYSPEQQTIIYDWLAENDLIADTAPKGYVSIGTMSKKMGFGGERVILHAIEPLGSQLGEVRRYKNYARITDFYSPTQAQMIREWIIKNAPKSNLAKAALAAVADEL